MGKNKLKFKFKKGFLNEVKNPLGKKPSVVIFQGVKPGFSARFVKSKRNLKGSSSDAEKFALRLAKKGHKKVTFN